MGLQVLDGIELLTGGNQKPVHDDFLEDHLGLLLYGLLGVDCHACSGLVYLKLGIYDLHIGNQELLVLHPCKLSSEGCHVVCEQGVGNSLVSCGLEYLVKPGCNGYLKVTLVVLLPI